MHCPLCGLTGRVLFSRHGYDIAECSACRHCFAVLPLAGAAPQAAAQHYERVYDDAYFQGGGAGYADYAAEAEMLRARGRWYAELISRHSPPGRLLEVGAAAGYLLEGFIDRGWRAVAVEPNARMAAELRTRLQVPVVVGVLETFADQWRGVASGIGGGSEIGAGDLDLDAPFDLVTLIQVAGHLIDPGQAFDALLDVTRPGSLVLCETWDSRSWVARLCGRYWHEYSPPSVVQYFSRAGLRRYFEQHGMQHVAQGRPPKSIRLDHARDLILHTLAGSRLERLARAALWPWPAGLSLPYPGDDVYWSLWRRR